MAEFIHTDRVRDTVFDVDAERLARRLRVGRFGRSRRHRRAGASRQRVGSDRRRGALARCALAADLRLGADRGRGEDVDARPPLRRQGVDDDAQPPQGDGSAQTARTCCATSRKSRASCGKIARAGFRSSWKRPIRSTPRWRKKSSSAFGDVLGADPIVTQRVNPDLIAGFVIRVGDRVYDGSIRTRLEQMRLNMIDRAVDAIQRNPRQFVDKARFTAVQAKTTGEPSGSPSAQLPITRSTQQIKFAMKFNATKSPRSSRRKLRTTPPRSTSAKSAACWKSATASPGSTACRASWPAKWSSSPAAPIGLAFNLEENSRRRHHSRRLPDDRRRGRSPRTGKLLCVPVGDAVLGRVRRSAGQPARRQGPGRHQRAPPRRSHRPRRRRAAAGDASRCRPASRPSTR